MGLYSFLAGLPALLALSGFVVYQFIGQQKGSQKIKETIVGKLRSNSSRQAKQIEGLNPKQVAEAIRLDITLKSKVSDQDFQLLKQVLKQEHTLSVVVYGLAALLFIVGIFAFIYVQTRPPLPGDTEWHLESTDPNAKGWAVDTDDLKLSWKSSGPPQELQISLENRETGRQTESHRVSSTEQSLLFGKGSYTEILANRQLGATNRICAVAKSSTGAITSQEFTLYVGVNVVAIPDEQDNEIWVTALIDQASVENYRYQAKLIIWPKAHAPVPLSFGDDMVNPKTVFKVPDLAALDWDTVKIAYFGPDDPRIVRTGPLSR